MLDNGWFDRCYFDNLCVYKGAVVMFCTNCGVKNSDDACFCSECGKRINVQTSSMEENRMEEIQSQKIDSSQKSRTEKLKESVSVYFSLIGVILLILFFLGFLDKPLSSIIQVIFG